MTTQCRTGRPARRRRAGLHRTGVLALAALLQLALATSAWAGTTTVRWTHSDPSSVDGFRIHQRVVGGQFDLGTDVGNPAPDAAGIYTATVVVPDGIPVLVRMSAYSNASGITSGFSQQENTYQLLGAPGQPQVVLP